MSDDPTLGSFWRQQRHPRRVVLRAAALGFVGLSGTTLLACAPNKKSSTGPATASQPAAGPPRSGGTFETYASANPDVLDPQGGATGPSIATIFSVYSSLFRFRTGTDPKTALNWEPVSDLAQSSESSDGQTWTIKLRPDAAFQNIPPVNGHAVAAEDIKATFVRTFSMPRSTAHSLLSMIDPAQIETPAADTVVFKLRSAFAPFPSSLAGTAGAILPREALAGAYDPAKTLIGSGPFMLDSFTPDVAIALKKNPNWYLRGQPYVDGVRITIIPDAAQQLAQFTAGHLDELYPAATSIATAKQNNPKATVVETPSSQSWVLLGHLDHPASPYSDLQVRQALSMAIDRNALGRAVYNNAYSNTAVLSAALGKWALAPDQLGPASRYYQYNLSDAKKLVDRTPVAKQVSRLLYPTPFFGDQFNKLCQGAGPMLAAAGFPIETVQLDYEKDFIAGGKGARYGNYPDGSLLASTQVVTGGPEATLNGIYRTGSVYNQMKFSDPKLDAMLDQMLGTLDAQARLAAVQQIQRYIAATVSPIPLPCGVLYTMVQPRIQNYNFSGGSNSEGPGTFPYLWIKQ